MVDTSAPVLSFRLGLLQGSFRLDVEGEAGPGVTALFGPSGSGKTTTLHCIAGLRTPDTGYVRLNGRDLFSRDGRVNLPPERRRIGMVFQEGALFPHMDVASNIRYGWKLADPGRRRVDVDQAIRLLGIEPLLRRSPDSLSGGERQRVALARALAMSPELLLLDEPLASVDARLRGVALGYLKRAHRELRIPIIYVSHSISEVMALADHAIVLDAGEKVAEGRPRQVLLQSGVPTGDDGPALENLLDGEVVDPGGDGQPAQIRVGKAVLRTRPVAGRAPGSPVMLAIDASDVILASSRPSPLSARNIMPGVLGPLNETGERVYAQIDIGVELTVEVTPDAARALGLAQGQDVYAILKSSSITVLDS
ncbi:MAG: molybdenum ABC transporter ATP-binding protein [Chloroflexota bacterium]